MSFLDQVEEAMQKLTPIIEEAAPLIAKSLGNPLAGLGLSVLAHIFDGDAQNVPELVSKVANDSQLPAKLNNAHLLFIKTAIQTLAPILDEVEKLIVTASET